MRRPRAGFSALEIMVAVTLATIGGAVLSIRMAPARSIARSTSCESNMKQLSLAMHMYAMDNSGRMPPTYNAFDSLMPYAKNREVFKCPAAPEKTHTETETPAEDQPISGPQKSEEAEPIESDYIMRPLVQTDDLPGLVIVGDDTSDRHPGRRWVGARLDGAAFLWPANQWESRLGWVMRNGATKR